LGINRHRKEARWRKYFVLFLCLYSIVITVAHFPAINPFHTTITRKDITSALDKMRVNTKHLLKPLTLKIKNNEYVAIPTLNLSLQKKVEKIFRKYKPLYAAFVAMDPETGKVLAMADYSKDGSKENLSVKATFPAASVFKLITSAAVINENKLSPSSKIPFNGSYTTLYKKNLNYNVSRWTRYIRLEDALAKSHNSVFGKIAIHGLGRKLLQKYADAFGFNKKINFDIPVETSVVIVPEDKYGIAESGSGFTKRQTLSPLQAAMIASTIINKGITPTPYFIENVFDDDGDIIYESKPKPFGQPISISTAKTLSKMMERTITKGTARKNYRDYKRNRILSKLFIGAKTGSLSGNEPRGKYDWFVGFAQAKADPKQKIAFASLIINGKFWRVKSSYVARQAILEYFDNIL